MEELRTILRYEEEFAGLGIWLMYRDEGGVYCAKRVELEFERIKDYPLLPVSTINFSGGHGTNFLRGMANELARLGFLPDLAKQNEKQLAATQTHLEDMRALVFNHNPYE